jgi:hypothetical protein
MVMAPLLLLLTRWWRRPFCYYYRDVDGTPSATIRDGDGAPAAAPRDGDGTPTAATTAMVMAPQLLLLLPAMLMAPLLLLQPRW